MGNIQTCCVASKARLNCVQHRGPVELEDETEIYVALVGDTVTQEPAPQETEEEIFKGNRDSHHLCPIRDWKMPQAHDQRKSIPFNHEPPGRPPRRYSSCSMIFLDNSTLAQPDGRKMTQCVSLAVYRHIKHRKANRSLDIFDEKLHPITKEKLSEEYFECDPEYKRIYRFLASIFKTAWLPAQCAIISLIYIERLLSRTEIDLCPTNWKRIVMGAILVACHFWHDEIVWNMEMTWIFKDMTLKDINELERQYLNLLEYDLNVPINLFAKYYFDLRCLAEDSHLYLVFALLTRERALDLQAMSRQCEDEDLCSAALTRSSSDGNFFAIRQSNAILS